MKNEIGHAMGLYPIRKHFMNLLGLEAKEYIDTGCRQFPGSKIVSFEHPYTKILIDLFIMDDGELFISTSYSAEMKINRDEVCYIKER